MGLGQRWQDATVTACTAPSESVTSALPVIRLPFPHFRPMQILLNLKTPKPEEPARQYQLRLALRRAAIKWLLDQTPDPHVAIGTDVPTHGSVCRADVGAAWFTSQRVRLGDGHVVTLQVPSRTILVLCSTSRQDCWPQCTDAERLLSEIATLKRELRDIEQQIRANEPELRDTNMLFDEYAVWNYHASKDKNYHRLVRHIAQMEGTLFKGSRLSKLGRSMTANEIYLAVPKGVLTPDEILSSWGMLEIDPKTLESKELKPAEKLTAAPELQASLAMAIAECSTRQVADCHGLKINENKPASIVKMPTFRRTPITPSARHLDK